MTNKQEQAEKAQKAAQKAPSASIKDISLAGCNDDEKISPESPDYECDMTPGKIAIYESQEIADYAGTNAESSKLSPQSAGAIVTQEGVAYVNTSIRGSKDNPPQYNKELQDVLDSIPIAERGKGHGFCWELRCVQQMLERKEPKISGSVSQARLVKYIKHGKKDNHGKRIPGCSTCKVVLKHFGITDLGGEDDGKT